MTGHEVVESLTFCLRGILQCNSQKELAVVPDVSVGQKDSNTETAAFDLKKPEDGFIDGRILP